MTTLSFNGSPQDLKLLLGISKKISFDLKVIKEKKRVLNKEQNEFKNLLREGLTELKTFREEEKSKA